MTRPPLSLEGKGADGRDGAVDWLCDVVEDRSSFRGRWRDGMGTSGDDGGSFFTVILGGWPCLALWFA